MRQASVIALISVRSQRARIWIKMALGIVAQINFFWLIEGFLCMSDNRSF